MFVFRLSGLCPSKRNKFCWKKKIKKGGRVSAEFHHFAFVILHGRKETNSFSRFTGDQKSWSQNHSWLLITAVPDSTKKSTKYVFEGEETYLGYGVDFQVYSNKEKTVKIKLLVEVTMNQSMNQMYFVTSIACIRHQINTAFFTSGFCVI